MMPLSARRIAAALTLSALLLACCLPSLSDTDEAASTDPTNPPATPEPARELSPLAPPLAGGSERPMLGRQLIVDVPAGAASPTLSDQDDGLAGRLGEAIVGLLDGSALQLEPRDLPCTVGDELEAQARAEFARLHPEVTERITVRRVVTRDASLRVVELVPNAPFEDGNYLVLAVFVVDAGGHAIWIPVMRYALAEGFDVPADDDAARELAESVAGTLRLGPWPFEAPAGERGLTDLFEEITVPQGWVLSASNCCNEQPPYMSRFVETVAPIRALGAPARAEVTARNGICPPGDGSVPGNMFGEAIQWSRTPDGLCWQQHPIDADDPLGVAWEVRGDTEADLNEAITIAATAR